MSDYKIESHPFSWNDKMAQLAIEDFDSIWDLLPYCQAQSIGLALAKLKMIEDKEKDTPYNPEFLHMINDTRGKFKCKCGHIFSHECPTFPDESMQYCDRCGQKLDWKGDKI